MDPVSQWISVNVSIADAHKELAMDYAFTLGGTAILEEDQNFQVSYPLDENVQLILEEFKTFLNKLDPTSSVTEDIVNRENWNKNWQAYFKPTEISSRLLILPEWEDPNKFPQAVITRIRPAMAFGTGTHETTQLCLELLEKCVQSNEYVLDVGTGSGILGITALHLGASQVHALENDPLTEENVNDNLALNNIHTGFELEIGENPNLKPPYDLMVINIIRARLFPILPNFYQAVRSGGKVIVSGLLSTEDKETRDLLSNSPWSIVKSYTKNEWIAYICEVD